MFSLKKVTAHSKLHNTLIKLLKEKKEESEAEEESCHTEGSTGASTKPHLRPRFCRVFVSVTMVLRGT